MGTLEVIQTTDLVRLEARARIDALEQKLRSSIASGVFQETLHDGGTEEGNGECQHFFGDGVYVRSLLIPAGTCVIGRLHKQARVCLILAGRCRIVDEYQELFVQAPWIGEFRAGSKTAVFAETDTLWAACLGTDLKDSKTAFDALTCESHEAFRLECLS